MNPIIDQLAVGSIVAGALAFFVLRFQRKRAAGKNCDGDCGCSSAKVGKIPQ